MIYQIISVIRNQWPTTGCRGPGAHPVGKLAVICVMIAGRHRGLPRRPLFELALKNGRFLFLPLLWTTQDTPFLQPPGGYPRPWVDGCRQTSPPPAERQKQPAPAKHRPRRQPERHAQCPRLAQGNTTTAFP